MSKEKIMIMYDETNPACKFCENRRIRNIRFETQLWDNDTAILQNCIVTTEMPRYCPICGRKLIKGEAV